MKIYISSKQSAEIVLTYNYADWATNIDDKIGGEWCLCGIESYYPLLRNPSLMYDPVKFTQSIHIEGSILQAIQLQKTFEQNFKIREVDPDIHYFKKDNQS